MCNLKQALACDSGKVGSLFAGLYPKPAAIEANLQACNQIHFESFSGKSRSGRDSAKIAFNGAAVVGADGTSVGVSVECQGNRVWVTFDQMMLIMKRNCFLEIQLQGLLENASDTDRVGLISIDSGNPASPSGSPITTRWEAEVATIRFEAHENRFHYPAGTYGFELWQANCGELFAH